MKEVIFKDLKELSNAEKESIRAIKSNIQFCGDDIKIILFTSCIPNEGKSTVTFNLARSFAAAGKKVLLIDSDMRGSAMLKHLKGKTGEKTKIIGLSHYLSGQMPLDEILYSTPVDNMTMIFSGPPVPNPTEILEKKYFVQLIDYARKNFDYVLIDCAPIGAVIDAAVIAKHCDGAILVVAQGVVGSREIVNAKRQLEAAEVRILGVILNKVKIEKHHYGKYYTKHHNGYYGGYYGEY
jgi:capsular exopolysaccharide synthesis family protein